MNDRAAPNPFASIPAGADRSALLAIAFAALASFGLVAWLGGSALLAGGAAAVTLGVASGLLAANARVRSRGMTLAAPIAGGDRNDWVLARAVADASDDALAVTDRAGRVVCANDRFVDWFGTEASPVALPVDAATLALIADAGRTAWRDGEAAVADFPVEGGSASGAVARAGRAADHLVWRFRRHQRLDPALQIIEGLRGRAGIALGEAGLMAALVSAGGTIRASNEAFRLRATANLAEPVEGSDFAQWLRVDRHGVLRFSREAGAASAGQAITAPPVRLIEVALDRDLDASPLLLLLIDDDGAVGERSLAAEQVERLVLTMPVALALVDRDGRFRLVNSAFVEVFGVPADRPMPSYPSDLVIGEDKAALGETVRRNARGNGAHTSLAVRAAAAPDRTLTLGLSGVRGVGDATVLLTVEPTANASTSATEQQVAQATKMQMVGTLAGGIAHDFNNILTAIIGSCDLLLLRHASGDSDYEDLQGLKSNAHRAANLTRQLLAFSRQQTLRPQTVSLSDIVADVTHLLERSLGNGVTLAVKHGRGVETVRADPTQIEQVILNLVVNARDAMPRGGTVTLSTRAVGASEVDALGEPAMPPGDYALLQVADTGTGIPPDVLPKIFEPFFTTKDVGQGTGLGLATAYGIVKQSGGFIFADSEVGKGTTFSVYLPVHRGEGESTPATPPAPKASASGWGSGTILVVEDEDMVRAVAERALTRAGYTVLTASNGEEGLEVAQQANIDLVVSDVMMPQMDGPTMTTRLREKRPDLPVLFMSGYAEEQLRQSIALSNVAFLAKPFSVAQLCDAVNDIRGST